MDLYRDDPGMGWNTSIPSGCARDEPPSSCRVIAQLEERRHVVNSIVLESAMIGIVLAVARRDEPPQSLVFIPDPGGSGANHGDLAPDSLFAVASITKLATALGVLRLAAAGLLNLDADLDTFLPGCPSAVAGVSLRRILSHTAGLPYEVALPAGEAWADFYPAVNSDPHPGQRFSYSSFGYDLAGVVAQTISGEPYAQFIQNAVLAPLAIEGYFGWEPRPSVVRTGYFDYAFNEPDRKFMGKPSGGMLTTAAGAVRLVQAYAWPVAGLTIPGASLFDARSDQTGGLHAGHDSVWLPQPPWGLGPEVRGPNATKAAYHYTPTASSSSSFGHFGASGCVTWCDPLRELSWAILSVRTTGPNPWHYPAWRRIGKLVYEAADAEA
jgi:CubicO group peptidase (beta-lactamase class C family)